MDCVYEFAPANMWRSVCCTACAETAASEVDDVNGECRPMRVCDSVENRDCRQSRHSADAFVGRPASSWSI